MDQRHPVGIKVSLLALLLSGMPALAIPNPYPSPYPQPMPGQTLLFPSAGVVCDQPAQRCFDSMGLSLGLTRQYFGAFAEQNALNSLGGRRPGPVFQLSDGSRCNVRQFSCWSGAGYGQPIIHQQLTSQLFGGMPRPNPYLHPPRDPHPSPHPAATPAYAG